MWKNTGKRGRTGSVTAIALAAFGLVYFPTCALLFLWRLISKRTPVWLSRLMGGISGQAGHWSIACSFYGMAASELRRRGSAEFEAVLLDWLRAIRAMERAAATQRTSFSYLARRCTESLVLMAEMAPPKQAVDLYRQAWEHDGSADAGRNLAAALERVGRTNEAKAAWAMLGGHHPSLASELGDYLLNVRADAETAAAVYRAGAAAQPDDPALRIKAELLVPPVEMSAENIRRRRKRILYNAMELRDEFMELRHDGRALAGDPGDVGTGHIYASTMYPTQALMWQAENDLAIKRAVGELLSTAYPDLTWRAPRCGRQTGKYRLGVISDASAGWALATCWGPVFRLLHDAGIEVFLYHPTTLPRNDAAAVRTIADNVRKYHPGDWRGARSLVARDNLDVFYNPNLGQELTASLLGFSRLAPVQVMDGGYTGTSGLPETDYYLMSEPYLTPEADSAFSEKLLRVPGLPSMYWDGESEQVDAISRTMLGLPEDKCLYFCIQDPRKLHPEFDTYLAKIVVRDPNGVLVLSQSGIAGIDEALRCRLSTTIPAEKLFFLPFFGGIRPTYLGALMLQDVGLAAWRFCGGTTFADHCRIGLPLVTREAEYFSGRFVSGAYREWGLEQLVARSEDEYVDIAVALARDERHRQDTRALLRDGIRRYKSDAAARAADARALVDVFLGMAREARAKEKS